MSSVADANKTVHKAATQWHYGTLVQAGFECHTPEQVGFVRKYTYIHPETKTVIEASTGVNADYWSNKTTGEGGYWGELKNHVN